MVSFATDILSTTFPGKDTRRISIKAAPPGQTTVIDLSFTRMSEAACGEEISFAPSYYSQKLVAYKLLPNGEALVITSWWEKEVSDTLTFAGGEAGDLVSSPKDPNNTGRPIRAVTYSNPKDGEFLRAWEWGCYAVPSLKQILGQVPGPQPRGTETRLSKIRSGAYRRS